MLRLLRVCQLVCLVLLAGGCAPTVEVTPPALPPGALAVPFTTLVQDEMGGGQPGQEYYEPKLVLVTSLEELDAIAPLLPPTVLAAAGWLDYSRYAALVLLRGYAGSLNYPVIIDQVALLDGRLVVGAQFWEPADNLASGAAITHPVHMVRIDKRDLPPGPLVLELQSRRFIMGPFSPRVGARAGFTPFTTTLMLDDVGAGIAPAAMQFAPQVRLLNSPEELAAVADQVDPQQLANAQIDWSGDALVGVWRGRQAGCHFRTVIEWLIVRDKQLSVYATFWQPAPIDAGCDMVTYPYHLVKVIRGQFAEVTEVKLATRSLQAPPVPQPIDVPFTTLLQDVLVAGPFLEQDYTPPHAVLVRTQEDAVRLASLLPPAAQPLALEVDYARYALVMLLRGSPGRPSYPIVIDRLTLLDGNLIVAAQMWLPPPGQESGQDLAQAAEAPITYPVHLALVAQDLLPPGLPSPTPLSLELRQMLVGQDGPAPQPVPAPASPLAPPSPLPGPSN